MPEQLLRQLSLAIAEAEPEQLAKLQEDLLQLADAADRRLWRSFGESKRRQKAIC